MARRPPPIAGRKPTKDELASFAGKRVDDLIGENLRLLFIGINPGLWTAAVNAHFARPGNRFWPALAEAKITSTLVDASMGLPSWAEEELLQKGIGITNLCPIATARADELSKEQLLAGGKRIRRLVKKLQPPVVAFLGATAYRAAYAVKAPMGRSEEEFEGAQLWVLPNPSGLNAHESVASLAKWYRQAAEAAGVDLSR